MNKNLKRAVVGAVALPFVYVGLYFLAGALSVIDPDDAKAAVKRWRGVPDDEWGRP